MFKILPQKSEIVIFAENTKEISDQLIQNGRQKLTVIGRTLYFLLKKFNWRTFEAKKSFVWSFFFVPPHPGTYRVKRSSNKKSNKKGEFKKINLLID